MSAERRMQHRKRIAITLFSVQNIRSGGGTERQFIRFYNHYRGIADRKFDIIIITDQDSFEELCHIGLSSNNDVVILKGGTKQRILPLRALNLMILNLSLLWYIVTQNIAVLHMPLANGPTFPAIAILSRIRKLVGWSGKISLNVTSCYLAHDMVSSASIIDQDGLKRFMNYFKWTNLDGIFSWYELFKTRSVKISHLKNCLIKSAKFYFADIKIIDSIVKKNAIVFAGRLTREKNPLLFIRSIDELRKKEPDLFARGLWEFKIFGGGPIQDEARQLIESLELDHVLSIEQKYDLSADFAASKIFVSLQDYENFTSLALLEAMGHRNAIIAVNVGETNRIIEDGVNGLLCSGFDPIEVSDKLIALIKAPGLLEKMMIRNEEIASEIHNVKNFTTDIESYFEDLIMHKRLSGVV